MQWTVKRNVNILYNAYENVPLKHHVCIATILVYLLFFICFAYSGVPDYDNSYVELLYQDPVSIFCVPDGSGTSFNDCYAFGGSKVDLGLTVFVLNVNYDPIIHMPAASIWIGTENSGLILCSGSGIADDRTDMYGRAYFTGPIAGGGYSDYDADEKALVYINGNALNMPGLSIYFNSADINGDYVVNLSDTILFTGIYFGDYHYSADFCWDGNINLSDLVLFQSAYNASCR